MKKFLILGLVFSIIGIFGKVNAYDDPGVIKGAIDKYKQKNYLGCISDLRMYTEKDPSSAIAWYYLGNAYMNIAMQSEAHEAFDRVVQLNTVPKLTSYSIQAKICMENPQKCEYQDFTYDEIKKLRDNPVSFLEEYFANLNGQNKNSTDVEIERLIKGGYSGSIHPSAQEFIKQERTKIKQNEINSNKAYVPDNTNLAQAVNLLKEQNNDFSNMAMFLENNNRNDNYAQFLKQYQNSGNRTISPEMIQLMMMQNSMPDF